MKIDYKLSHADFLAYQLYTSSKSELYKKKQSRSRIIVPIVYLLFGFYVVYTNGNNALGIGLAAFAVVWFAFFPKYSKWKYKNHFQKHIFENYKNRINQPIEIEFEENQIRAKDNASESTMNTNELKALIETKEHFYIKLTSDMSLILPKHSIANQKEFKRRILNYGATYVDELNWEWN